MRVELAPLRHLSQPPRLGWERYAPRLVIRRIPNLGLHLADIEDNVLGLRIVGIISAVQTRLWGHTWL